MIFNMLGFLLKLICYGALLAYVGWMLVVLWRLVIKPGKSGRLPWL